ncbi:MAG: c-type heme family protein [Acetobacteraceae bacterium]
MGLRGKFNLAIIAAFVIGYAGAGFALQQLFIANAREQVLQNARIMMSAANAIMSYTNAQVVPLIGFESKGKFLAASIPFFAAQTTFREVQKKFPDYTFRQPALNPTNPNDRATGWEADFIHTFANQPKLLELAAERITPTGHSLSLARPIRIDDPGCLTCHSSPEVAPASLVATYGRDNGFGWKLHQVIGAEIVSVPMAVPLLRARHAFLVFMAILLVMCVVIIIILNVLLHYIVIRPAKRMSAIATAVSMGDLAAEEYEKTGSDEIALLSAAFNRMRRSLESAMQMLQR